MLHGHRQMRIKRLTGDNPSIFMDGKTDEGLFTGTGSFLLLNGQEGTLELTCALKQEKTGGRACQCVMGVLDPQQLLRPQGAKDSPSPGSLSCPDIELRVETRRQAGCGTQQATVVFPKAAENWKGSFEHMSGAAMELKFLLLSWLMCL